MILFSGHSQIIYHWFCSLLLYILAHRYPFNHRTRISTGLNRLNQFKSWLNSKKTAKMVAIEKETKLKEYMLMMGLSRNALWASWYLHYFLLLIIPCLLTMVVLTGNLSSYGSVLQMSDSFIVFIFLMLWESFINYLFHRSLVAKTGNCMYETLKGCSLISLGFLISSFFSKANTVSSMSALIIWLCAIPYDFVKNDMENQSSGLGSHRLTVRTRSVMGRPSFG